MGVVVGGWREEVALAPDHLDELLLEVIASRDDLVGVVRPNDKNTFVALGDKGIMSDNRRNSASAPHLR